MQGSILGELALQDRFTIGDLAWMLQERVQTPATPAPLPLTDRLQEQTMTHGMDERLLSEALGRGAEDAERMQLELPSDAGAKRISGIERRAIEMALGTGGYLPMEFFWFRATTSPFRPDSNKRMMLAGKKPAVSFPQWLDRITDSKPKVRVAASPHFWRRPVIILFLKLFLEVPSGNFGR
ncbi:hypothetical protein TrVFT333_005581 [Trichoderma virens FT-333]|nr:hypothetical protein TrVFT333_005581 [Trichoderma virens FT-333]